MPPKKKSRLYKPKGHRHIQANNRNVVEATTPVTAQAGDCSPPVLNDLSEGFCATALHESVLVYPTIKKPKPAEDVAMLKIRDSDKTIEIGDVNVAGPSTARNISLNMVLCKDMGTNDNTHIESVKEPVFEIDYSSDTSDDVLRSSLPRHDEEVAEMLQDLGRDLEYERLQELLNARQRAADERLQLHAAIEEARARGQQLPSYLLASVANDDLPSHTLGAFNQVCRHCSALYFRCEQTTRGFYTDCCNNGAIVLPALSAMPPLMRRLYIGDHPLSRHFKKNIIKMNYIFQFASIEANMRDLPNRGPFVYAIQGKVYHRISNMNVINPEPRFAQVYFINPEDSVELREAEFGVGVEPQLIRDLEILLRQVNPYAAGFVHLRERYELERDILDIQNLHMPNLVLEFVHVHGQENRNLDVPAVQEVAVVYDADNELAPTRNMRIYLRNRPDRFQEIHTINPHSDPLCFPILFPTGDQGWHTNMYQANNRTRITLADYYCYRFAYRTLPDEQFQVFHHSGKLFQQFVVNSYAKIEAQRLLFISQNQNLLRAELYNGLVDHLHRHADQEDAHIGRMVIMPSTFIGSPRCMVQLFQDCLAIVQKLGHPSLFITITCNPKWPEIVNNIPEGDESGNHPPIVSRVFKAKLDELLEDLGNRQVMGVCIAKVHVIEFQKRGLPHAHLLLILRAQDRLEEAYRIDSLIRAELPDVTTEPRLYELICKNNIHGPCYQGSVCMTEGKCAKHFPKRFSEETIIDEKGFVLYKRRDDGRIAIIRRNGRDVRLDNRWVVPYNPYLTLKYNCHINVEACPSTRSIKYLYKYIWKGVDKCLVRIRDANQIEYDEVNAYVTARYLAPPEAMWRILKYPLHENSHTVIRLPVHLPQEQVVVFRPADMEQALHRYQHTHLTRWFELNQHDEHCRALLYSEVPLHYVWKRATKNWSNRQRGGSKIISRMCTISPRQGELYFLRLLLLHVRGAQTWDDVKTVEGQVCDSFREACSRRHLLQDDSEWVRCLTEAQHTHMPYQLRQLFAYILVFCEVADPVLLWQRFGESMTDDYMDADALLPGDVALQMALVDIQRTLSIHNKRLAGYGLPQPNVNLIIGEDIDVQAERNEGLANAERLNHEQRFIYDAVTDAVERNRVGVLPVQERLFSISSAGGTGKSFLFNTLISALSGANVCVISCCFSGIGATVLKRGRTIHSTFNLKLNPDEMTTSGVTPNSLQGRYIAGSELLIIDEISMVSKVIFNIIDKALKDITRCNACFGGKVILLGGDFRQLLPVIEHADRPTIVANCVKNSVHWPLFTQYMLNVNMRVLPAEIEFSEWLMQLGNNTLPTFSKSIARNLICIPERCVVQSKEQLIEKCFEGMTSGDCRNVAILSPKNEDCDYINEQVLDKIEGVVKIYLSADSLDDRDQEALVINYTVEFLNTLKPSGFPQHRLCLKVGAVVLLLRNLNVKKNLCNGTKLLIRELHNNFISAERLDSGRLTGEIVFIPRIDFSTIGSTYPISFKRRQYPVQLAYSMTINKSQGQTLDTVGIYLPKTAFAHGALYVAASRARSFNRLHMFVEDGNEQGKIAGNPGVYTKNIVYGEVLL